MPDMFGNRGVFGYKRRYLLVYSLMKTSNKENWEALRLICSNISPSQKKYLPGCKHHTYRDQCNVRP
jgi:hypothetical protein